MEKDNKCHLSQRNCGSSYKVNSSHSDSQALRRTILVTASLITIIFFICVVFMLVKCYCLNHHCQRRRRHQHQHQQQQQQQQQQHQQQPQDELLDEERGPMTVVEHHIWNIRTVGLRQSVIESIAIVKYKRRDGRIQGTECSVCLTEFEEDEDIRLLPKCSHAFHITCIDAWLTSHKNCPSCRTQIDFENVTPTEDQTTTEGAAVVEDSKFEQYLGPF